MKKVIILMVAIVLLFQDYGISQEISKEKKSTKVDSRVQEKKINVKVSCLSYLEYTKIVPNGKKMEDKEIEDYAKKNKLGKVFFVSVENIPANEECILQANTMFKKTLQDGLLTSMCNSAYLSTVDFFPGQPYYISVLKKKDRSVIAEYTVFPNPIETKSPSGRHINVAMGSAVENVFLITGTGFSKNEQLYVSSHSGNEILDCPVPCDENGGFRRRIEVGVLGKTKGKTKLKVYSPKTKETLELDYKWGIPLQNRF